MTITMSYLELLGFGGVSAAVAGVCTYLACRGEMSTCRAEVAAYLEIDATQQGAKPVVVPVAKASVPVVPSVPVVLVTPSGQSVRDLIVNGEAEPQQAPEWITLVEAQPTAEPEPLTIAPWSEQPEPAEPLTGDLLPVDTAGETSPIYRDLVAALRRPSALMVIVSPLPKVEAAPVAADREMAEVA